MKKVFIVVMDYEESTESMFTEDGLACTLDNQLFDLKERKHIKTYQDTDVHEVKEELLSELLIHNISRGRE